MNRPSAMRHRLRTGWRPLVAVLAAGVLMRVVVMLMYSTAVYYYFGGDSSRYLRLESTGYKGLFGDPGMVAGYPAFLDAMQAVSSRLSVTIGLQHLFGVATAALLFGTLVRGGAPRWVALVPAAAVALSGDHMFLEHALLTESLWTVLLAGAFYAVVRALDTERRTAWLAAGGVLLALSATTRHVSLLLPVVIVPWLLIAFGGGGWRRRLVAAAAFALPFAVVIGAYLGAARIADGYAGFTDLSGFNQYARVAPFADCKRFTPPAGTQALCETTPPQDREGPFFYTFSPDSPRARAGFGVTPGDVGKLGAFARAAVIAQPLDFARAVLEDVARFGVPDLGRDGAWRGSTPQQMSFGWTVPIQQAESQQQIAAAYATVYSGVSRKLPDPHLLTVLEAYQETFRLHALELLLATLAAFAGVLAGVGRSRLVTLLLLAAATYLFVLPAALSSYEARYAVAPSAFLVAAGAIGAWSVVARRRRLPG